MADVYNQNNSEFDEFMKTPHIFFLFGEYQSLWMVSLYAAVSLLCANYFNVMFSVVNELTFCLQYWAVCIDRPNTLICDAFYPDQGCSKWCFASFNFPTKKQKNKLTDPDMKLIIRSVCPDEDLWGQTGHFSACPFPSVCLSFFFFFTTVVTNLPSPCDVCCIQCVTIPVWSKWAVLCAILGR